MRAVAEEEWPVGRGERMKRREQKPQQVEKREARGTIRKVVAARQGERNVVVCVCGSRCVVGVW